MIDVQIAVAHRAGTPYSSVQAQATKKLKKLYKYSAAENHGRIETHKVDCYDGRDHESIYHFKVSL